MSNFESIENVFFTIEKLIAKGQERVTANPQDKFTKDVIPFSLESSKGKNDRLLTHFAEVHQAYKKSFFLLLFAEFERQLFSKLNIAIEYAELVIENNYKNDKPMYSNRKGLIISAKGFNGIGEVQKVVLSNIDPSKSKILGSMKHYRDYLIHGERFRNKHTESFEREYDVNDSINFMKEFLQSL